MTICTRNRVAMLGEIVGNEMVTNEYGRIAGECWMWLSTQYSYVKLDEWVVMPNHLHGVLILAEGDSRGDPTVAKKSLGSLVGAFKTVSTRRINEARQRVGEPVWQRNFHEHILRGEQDFHRIGEYIINNPGRWAEDEENPGRLRKN